MDKRNCFELNDDELDKVVGGIDVGDRVKVDCHMICYCPGCGRGYTSFYGTVTGKNWYEKNKHYILMVKADCCGYESRAVDFICTIE